MDSISLEDLFYLPRDGGAPGDQLYLYRLLGLLANRESGDIGLTPFSYHGAKKLSLRLDINSPERLEKLFRNVGLGDLKLEICDGWLRATLNPAKAFAVPLPASQAGIGKTNAGGGCDLEHGLIDGALELITGLPVSTAEVKCWTRGDNPCVFEAVRADDSGIPGKDRAGLAPGTSAFGGPAPAHRGFRPGRAPVPGRGPAASESCGQVNFRCSGELGSWFVDLAIREVAKAKRHGRYLSVLCIDLDHLGQVNLRYGRPAGDQVISSAAAAISRTCRAEDIVWHHGEDEFTVVLADTDAGGAEIMARRLADAIPSAGNQTGMDGPVSACIGISTYPVHGSNMAELLAGARAALHLAKSRGNGVVQMAGKASGASDPVKYGGGRWSGFDKPVGSSEKDGFDRPFEPREQPGGHGARTRADSGDETGWSINNMTAAREEHSGIMEVADEVPEDANACSGCSIVIASARPLLLAGMRRILADAKDARVFAEVEDSGRLPLIVDDIRPDLVFADYDMAAANDFALVRLVASKNLPTKLAVSAAEVDHELIRLAAECSVDGIIMQTSSQKEILAGLAKIYQGQKVLPEEVVSALSDLDSKRRVINELSEREIEVLCLVSEGKSNSQISAELFITVNTVRFHLANIYQKLGVSNRTEAANYYLRQDLGCDGQIKLL